MWELEDVNVQIALFIIATQPIIFYANFISRNLKRHDAKITTPCFVCFLSAINGTGS